MNDEHVILEPSAPFRKPDAVLVEKGLPEQLVGRKQSQERGPVEFHLTPVTAEERDRHGLAMSDHLADYDV